MSAKTRAFVEHAVTFSGGAFAAITYMASKSVDLYAAYDHLHTAVQELMAAWAFLGPILATSYAIYKATTKQKLLDVVKDPKALEVAAQITPSPQVVAVAEALKKNGH